MVRVTASAGVGQIVLDDAATGHALSETMGDALGDALATLGADVSVHAIVLAADGDTFSTGAPRDLLLKLTRGELRTAGAAFRERIAGVR